MRLMVTGGAGFIGSWTVEALVAAGHEVLVYDSFVTGQSAYLRTVADDVQVVRGDIRQPLKLHRAVRRFGPQAIIHLAACVSVPLSLRRPLSSHAANTDGTLAVLEAARAAQVARVVLASSAAVYGSTSHVPISEKAVLAPLSPYALHKRVAEDYARLYSTLYGLDTVALRYFNVFGPRQDPASPYSGVIARFMAAARAGRSVTIEGDGRQTRDFVFVGDVAQATMAAVTTPLHAHHIINVATGQETSLHQLRLHINELTGRPLQFTTAPPRPADVRRSCGEVTQLRELLGMTCTTSVATGLAAILSYGDQASVGW